MRDLFICVFLVFWGGDKRKKKSVGFPGKMRFQGVWLESVTLQQSCGTTYGWLSPPHKDVFMICIIFIFFNVSPFYDTLRIMNQIWLITLNKLPVETNPKTRASRFLSQPVCVTLCNADEGIDHKEMTV